LRVVSGSERRWWRGLSDQAERAIIEYLKGSLRGSLGLYTHAHTYALGEGGERE